MSGGFFDHRNYYLSDFVELIKQEISNNKKENSYGDMNNFTDETIEEFKNAIKLLEKASVYVHRIDWLLMGDDGEKNFHSRLKEDLKEYE